MNSRIKCVSLRIKSYYICRFIFDCDLSKIGAHLETFKNPLPQSPQRNEFPIIVSHARKETLKARYIGRLIGIYIAVIT